MGFMRSRKHSSRRMTRFAMMALFVLFIGIIWYSYPKNDTPDNAENVPVIRADARPIKVTPEDPGGMEILYRDSTIFNTLNNDAEDAENLPPNVENLFADKADEKPLPREDLFADTQGDMPPAPNTAPETRVSTKTDTDATDVAPVQKPQAIKQAAGHNEMPDDAQPSTQPEQDRKSEKQDNIADVIAGLQPSQETKTQHVSDAPKPSIKPATPAKPKTARVDKTAERAAQVAPAASDAHFYVQLGSLSSEQAAQNAWKTFQRQFPAELNSLGLHIEKADLGTRGTYYRVQGGPVTESQARSICSVISAQRQGGCLVTKIR